MIKKSLQTGFCLIFACGFSVAQHPIDLDDFGDPGKTWREVGDITVHPSDGSYETEKGEGIFVNIPGKKNRGEDIRTSEEYGDFDLSFEYLMFPGSNSGVYMQGRYEIQLLDSWNKKTVTSGDNGGIYERWIEDEQRGYQGHAPRQNASKAPGLWQEMRISFQAPRFDASGNKTANARILSVHLNDVLLHENVELLGPTRGSWGEESAKGPIRIQGDHGPVAFRNMTITTFDNASPELNDLTYEVYKGLVTDKPDFSTMDPVSAGETSLISAAVNTVQGPFLIRFRGKLDVPVSGTYSFNAMVNGGGGILMIDGEEVIGPVEWNGEGSVSLGEGEHDLEFLYAKLYDWAATGVGLRMRGPGIRWVNFHDENMNMGTTVDPIYVDVPKVHRSFVDIEGGKRLIRAVSVGTESGLHYTYDMDHGALVQGWHGAFMDATPMWNNRGDGSAVPRGSVTMLDGPSLLIGEGSWNSDTTGTGFRPRGYEMDDPGMPTFVYDIYGGTVKDKILVSDGTFKRALRTQGLSSQLSVALARGNNIIEVDRGLYNVDGKFFIRTSSDADIRVEDGVSVLTTPVKATVRYEIIF